MSSKWCCVLAVVCLSVILLSLDADAQPTVDDDSSQCGSASIHDVVNMVKIIASNQQDNTQEIKDEMKKLLVPRTSEWDEGQPSKQALVSALVGESLVCF